MDAQNFEGPTWGDGCRGLNSRWVSTFMTKQELLDQLKSSGAIHRYSPGNPLWKAAFKLYGEAHQVNLSMKCSKCVDKVSEWIKA